MVSPVSCKPVLVSPGLEPHALMRFIVRRPWPDRDGLILGCRVADQGLLKPDSVYELKQVFGELILYDVGTSRVAAGDAIPPIYEVGATWQRDVNSLVREFQGRLWVPREFDEPRREPGSD